MIKALRSANTSTDRELPTAPEMVSLQGGEEWFLHLFVLTRWEMVQPVLTKAIPQPAKAATMCMQN